MKNNDSISIITPAYKATKFIDDYVDGFLKQKTSLNFELIIGIDGCLETKTKLLSMNLPDFIKLYWFDENHGAYIIRNSLVKETLYPYIMFFDIDDIPLENFVESVKNIRYHYDIIRHRQLKKKRPAFCIIGIWKETWNKMGGFQPWKCSADLEFLERSNIMGLTQEAVPEKTFFRRVHDGQLTIKKETTFGSPLRNHYKLLVGWDKSKISPITKSYKLLKGNKDE